MVTIEVPVSARPSRSLSSLRPSLIVTLLGHIYIAEVYQCAFRDWNLAYPLSYKDSARDRTAGHCGSRYDVRQGSVPASSLLSSRLMHHRPRTAHFYSRARAVQALPKRFLHPMLSYRHHRHQLSATRRAADPGRISFKRREDAGQHPEFKHRRLHLPVYPDLPSGIQYPDQCKGWLRLDEHGLLPHHKQ